MDYLLKPFSKERFDGALDKWLRHSGRSAGAEKGVQEMLATPVSGSAANNRIVVRNNNEITIVPVSEIVYIFFISYQCAGSAPEEKDHELL